MRIGIPWLYALLSWQAAVRCRESVEKSLKSKTFCTTEYAWVKYPMW